MHLAIIIVSYNTQLLLRRCLSSVFDSLAASPELEAEVCVVDNASPDGSADMVRGSFPQVSLLALEENLGFAGGNNLALQRLGFSPLRGEARRSQQLATRFPNPRTTMPRWVLLLNPDTELEDDAPGQMARFLAEHPGAGGCGARLHFADGRFQHGAFQFPGLAQLALDLFPPPGRLHRPLLDSRLNGRYSRSLYDGHRAFAVDFALGACLMVQSQAILEVGLLDEGYFMYCEEMDWQRRLHAAGWPLYCLPTARVLHHGAASTAKFRGPMLLALWRSRLRYFQRYHGPLFNWLASRLVRQGMRFQAHQAFRLSSPDRLERLTAYQQIRELT